ncbi:MAG: DUF523 and DUF1722 domain-containing protein [Myxococcota bacterium]
MNGPSRPRIGVSACLLGEGVRFDTGHKRSDYVASTLSRFVELIPVCPEVESGMGVPRESMRLFATPTGLGLVGNRTGVDYGDGMAAFAGRRAAELAALQLDGFVLKKDSPTCGVERVRVYRQGGGQPSRDGRGLFTAALQARIPTLPLAEEGWLNDDGLRASFLERIFTHHRLRTSLLAAPTPRALLEFHADHKLLYMARSPERYRELGRIAAQAASRPLDTTLALYAAQAMAALAERSTPGKHGNVLQHILGYFKGALSAAEKQEFLTLVDEFRAGLHGLVVPLTLLLHYVRRHGAADWLRRQAYLQPYPRELGAR